jgi:methyl-accepting chemotaxis protein
VQSVASATEEMAASVVEIGRQVSDSNKIAREAVVQAERADARIAKLSLAASRIGDVTKLITTIAEQTNLLALNATIEAARADDTGTASSQVLTSAQLLSEKSARLRGAMEKFLATVRAA